MIFKIIHSTFEIDLLDTSVDVTETNQWFESNLKLKYSLPFTTTLTDELDRKLGMISHVNALNGIRYLEVKLYRYNQIFDAKFFIERLQNRELTASITFGYNEFPNFDKKLSELPLDVFDIAEPSLQDHALTIIGQTYPDVNYNFPKIKTTDDVFDTSGGQWLAFKGYLNNLVGSAFLTNSFDIGENQPINENIMQPMPYILHVLKKGFEDAGFTLDGDILDDQEYQNTLIPLVSKYYSNVLDSSTEWRVTQNMYQSLTGVSTSAYYEETIPVTEAGLYKILGVAYTRGFILWPSYIRLTFISSNGFENVIFDSGQQGFQENLLEIDITLQVIAQNLPATLKLESVNLPETLVNGEMQSELSILDVTVSKVAEYDADDFVYQSLVQPNKIDLTKCVPDITFGNFVKAIMNHRNYSLDIKDGVVMMNQVDTRVAEPPTQDLQTTEVKYPELEFLEQKSYLLKFQSQPEGYDYKPVLVQNSNILYSETQVDENTETIQIDLLPLKNDEENTINTAILHTADMNKLFVAIYDGTYSTTNRTQSNQPLLLPYSYENFYKSWLRFIIKAKVITWQNVMSLEDAFDLSVYKKSFAYGMALTLKEIRVNNKNKDYAIVQIEAYASLSAFEESDFFF